jgi:hypothetical protein
MATHGDFVMSPPAQGEPCARLPLVLEGNPGWTDRDFTFDATRPGDSSVDAGFVDKATGVTKFMPLTAAQARRAGMELIIRADLIDPQGATS